MCSQLTGLNVFSVDRFMMCSQLTGLNVFSVDRIKIKPHFTGLIQVILKIGIFCVDVSTFLCLKNHETSKCCDLEVKCWPSYLLWPFTRCSTQILSYDLNKFS